MAISPDDNKSLARNIDGIHNRDLSALLEQGETEILV